MITAKFYQKPDRGTIYMTLKGHAGTAPKGQDLVCSAATMMAYTVAQAVTFMHEQGKLTQKPKIYIREGMAMIIAAPTEDGYAEALHTFWVAQCGIHVLMHNYPEHVKLEYLRV